MECALFCYDGSNIVEFPYFFHTPTYGARLAPNEETIIKEANLVNPPFVITF